MTRLETLTTALRGLWDARLSTRVLAILAICLVLPVGVGAKTIPKELIQEWEGSLVRIIITGGSYPDGKKRGPGYASAFVWKEKRHVVTSLHAMRPAEDAQVWLSWAGPDGKNRQWEARVIKVHEEADLVMLEVQESPEHGWPGWTPLTRAGEVGGYGTELIALGYWISSPKHLPRFLVVATPDNTLSALPTQYANKLKELGIPSMDLKVPQFDQSSLAPGYSGAPVLAMDGTLMAIGDGGIDAGARDVSWGIPATELAKLEASTVTELPASLVNAPTHYSAEDVRLPPKKEGAADAAAGAGEQVPETSTTAAAANLNSMTIEELSEFEIELIVYGEVTFFYTKTRTLGELLESANEVDREEILEMISELGEAAFDLENDADLALEVFADLLEYDIYEDANSGIIVAVPSGTSLRTVGTHDGEQALWVDFGEEAMNADFPMLIRSRQHSDEARSFSDIEPEELLDGVDNMGEEMQASVAAEYAYPVMLDLDRASSKIAATRAGGFATLAYVVNEPDTGRIDGLTYTKVAIGDNAALWTSALFNGMTQDTLETFKACRAEGDDCASDELSDEYGRPGMMIHAAFEVSGMQNADGGVAVHFYLADGTPLMDYDQQYVDASGAVMAMLPFSTPYEDNVLHDFQMNVPYDQLHMNPGDWQLRLVPQLFMWDTGETVAVGDAVDFYFSN